MRSSQWATPVISIMKKNQTEHDQWLQFVLLRLHVHGDPRAM